MRQTGPRFRAEHDATPRRGLSRGVRSGEFSTNGPPTSAGYDLRFHQHSLWRHWSMRPERGKPRSARRGRAVPSGALLVGHLPRRPRTSATRNENRGIRCYQELDVGTSSGRPYQYAAGRYSHTAAMKAPRRERVGVHAAGDVLHRGPGRRLGGRWDGGLAIARASVRGVGGRPHPCIRAITGLTFCLAIRYIERGTGCSSTLPLRPEQVPRVLSPRSIALGTSEVGPRGASIFGAR
jgi:hypothetical protein